MKPISGLDPLDIGTRIEELKQLEHGWLDGMGLAPLHDGLDWLADSFERDFPADLPQPFLYPTPEGGVRAEWTRHPHESSLEIDLSARVGAWHCLNLETDADQSRSLVLDDPKDWAWLLGELRRLEGTRA